MIQPSKKGLEMSAGDARPRVGIARGAATYEASNVERLVASAHQRAGSPLDVIEPEQTVFFKPNLIKGCRENKPDEWEQIITNPAVVGSVLNEVATRLKSGRIVIGDAPQTDSDMTLIEDRMRLADLIAATKSSYPNIDFEVLDLRREYWIQSGSVTVERRPLPGDPHGAQLIDLAADSEFVGHSSTRYYGADYDFADTTDHHSNGKHEYLVSKSVLGADVFVNLPKMKTHKKAGVTLSLKNLVGINADKNYLPHYSLGPRSKGGDEFPDDSSKRRLEGVASRTFKRLLARTGGKGPVWGVLGRRVGIAVFGSTSSVIRSGNWWGNDTIWRMCLDLNKILLWYDDAGNRRSTPKPYVSIVDGIVAGEGDGPVDADTVPLGLIACGRDPVAVDLVCARLMGFEWRRLPILERAAATGALGTGSHDPSEIFVTGDDGDVRGVDSLRPLRNFMPHFGWRGRIELGIGVG